MAENNGAKILIIDDEPDLTDLVAFNLKARGFTVETLNNPNAGIGVARSFLPNLVILDVMMPDISGIQLCRMFRADPALKNVPIIFLTAKTEEDDRIQGLETGADDYICKPFSTKELVLRVESLLRRSSSGEQSAAGALLSAGKIVLDVTRHVVTISGKPVELTAMEFKFLHLLMSRRGRAQTREHLLVSVWNYETDIETRTIDTHVRRLREKLGGEASWIETIRGVGYRFAEK